MKNIAPKLLLAAIAAAMVSACGGGYGGDDRPRTTPAPTYMSPPSGA